MQGTDWWAECTTMWEAGGLAESMLVWGDGWAEHTFKCEEVIGEVHTWECKELKSDNDSWSN